MHMCIDVKPHIGVAIFKVVVPLKNTSHLGDAVVIKDGVAKLLRDGEEVTSIRLPEALNDLKWRQDLDGNGELYQRVRFGQQRFIVLPGLSPYSLPLPHLKKLTDSLARCKALLEKQGRVQVHGSCASCKSKLAALTLSRVLPLPSIDWNQDSHNWFCVCTSKETPTSKATTNRKLANEELRPAEDDLLYSESFVLCDKKSFGCETISFEDTVVSCSSCNEEIGLGNEDVLKLWSNSIIFSPGLEGCKYETDASKETTFCLIVNEIINEFKYLSVKVLLMDVKLRTIGLHVLESSGSTWMGDFDKGNPGVMHQIKNHTVLFKEGVALKDTHDVAFMVTPKVLEEGLRHLKSSGSKFFPSFCRRDPCSDFEFGILEVI